MSPLDGMLNNGEAAAPAPQSLWDSRIKCAKSVPAIPKASIGYDVPITVIILPPNYGAPAGRAHTSA